MGNNFRVVRGGRPGTSDYLVRLRAGASGHPSSAGGGSSVRVHDHVSLSRIYPFLQSLELAHRIQNLAVQVEQRSYWVSSVHLARGILAEEMLAA